jgi:thymidylate kinase
MRTMIDPDKADVILLPPAGSKTLAKLHDVLVAFHSHNIRYCYWKSTRRIHAVLRGESDLDLLVEQPDQHHAETILLAHDFKLFPAQANRDHPSILSFLGYDEASGHIVHIHLHFRLIVGQRLLRNYRLPWEDVVLRHTLLHPVLQIRMLDPTIEAVLLAVRSCVELRRSDPVALRSWQAVKRKIALDRADVAARVDPAALRDLAAALLNDDLAELLVNAIFSERELEDQGRFRRRVVRYLSVFRTYNALEAWLRGSWRALLWAAGNANRYLFLLPRPWSRRAPGGGCVIAIVGVDGSGKTTVTATIRTWLGAEVDVVPIYFGTGEGRPSPLLRPFKLLVPLARRILATKPKGASHGPVSDRPPSLLYSLLMMMWATIVAREKRNKLLAARRGAQRGLVIITDRYPQNEISGFNDGPLLTRLTTVPHWLRSFETAAYALVQRLKPDLVVKLDVLPETAARREPEMDPAIIRERIMDLQRLTFAGARIVRVDAEQPLVDVVRTVKREIWRLL